MIFLYEKSFPEHQKALACQQELEERGYIVNVWPTMWNDWVVHVFEELNCERMKT